MSESTLLLTAACCGFLGLWFGSRKAQPFGGLLLGLLFGPLGVLLVLALRNAVAPCPFCKENVKTGAVICPHCRQAVLQVGVTVARRPESSSTPSPTID